MHIKLASMFVRRLADVNGNADSNDASLFVVGKRARGLLTDFHINFLWIRFEGHNVANLSGTATPSEGGQLFFYVAYISFNMLVVRLHNEPEQINNMAKKRRVSRGAQHIFTCRQYVSFIYCRSIR